MVVSLLLLAGLLVTTLGADLLVRGASAIALRCGLSALVVGLTVVAFGTSAPELAVSISAALNGTSGIAVGNIVGSNIFNVAAILGIAALVRPLSVHRNVVRRDMPVMLGASVVFLLLLNTGIGITRWQGLLLVGLLCGYTIWSIRNSRRESALEVPVILPDGGQPTKSDSSILLCVGLVLVGFAMLIFGGKLFVDNAVLLARTLGWSEAVIGLTIVAAGTSLPELATSVVASLRRQTDIAVGNVVGSNIFNLLCIGGLTATVQPLESAGISLFDCGAMLVTSLLLLPLMRSGFRINRWEGFVLLSFFALYLWMVWP